MKKYKKEILLFAGGTELRLTIESKDELSESHIALIEDAYQRLTSEFFISYQPKEK